MFLLLFVISAVVNAILIIALIVQNKKLKTATTAGNILATAAGGYKPIEQMVESEISSLAAKIKAKL